MFTMAHFVCIPESPSPVMPSTPSWYIFKSCYKNVFRDYALCDLNSICTAEPSPVGARLGPPKDVFGLEVALYSAVICSTEEPS